MPRILGIGGRRVIDVPMPANNRLTVQELRNQANIGNQYSLARVADDGCPEEVSSGDYVSRQDNLQVLPRHRRG
jgi:hypothetical protein